MLYQQQRSNGTTPPKTIPSENSVLLPASTQNNFVISHLPPFAEPSCAILDISAPVTSSNNGHHPSPTRLSQSAGSTTRLPKICVSSEDALTRDNGSLTSDTLEDENHEQHASSRVWCCRNFCDLCPDVVKYIMHVILLIFVLTASQIGTIWARRRAGVAEIDAVAKYGILPTIFFYSLRCCSILAIPQVLFSILGHTCFNPFRERTQLRVNLNDAPRIIFRVVTRGNYPDLVQHNVERNLRTVHAAGVTNFFIEVVTDKPIIIRPHRRVLQTVVPADYRPSSGALFKARALQYCLEPTTCWVEDCDWLVHLDEETILTQYSLNGILNFATENNHDFGQGCIVYGNEHVVNWIFTLADSFRVADDMGKLQFQLRVLKRPVFGWKGSFVVARAGAERQVTFDHGPDGSVAEDTYFAFIAFQQGYRFGFIEGHMLEKSPFSFKDFLQQRKRWIQGLLLVAHSRKIGFHYKLLFFCSLYAWLLIPLSTVNLIVSLAWPIAPPLWLDCLNALLLVQSLYMYVFGAFKTCSLKRASFLRTLLYVTGALFTLPVNIVVENAAAIWGVLGKKHRFYIVDKNFLKRAGAAGFSTESLSPPPSVALPSSAGIIDAADIKPKLFITDEVSASKMNGVVKHSPRTLRTVDDNMPADVANGGRRRHSLFDSNEKVTSNDAETLQPLMSEQNGGVRVGDDDDEVDNLMGASSEVALLRSNSERSSANNSPKSYRGLTASGTPISANKSRNNGSSSGGSNVSSSERAKKVHGS